MLIRSPQLAGVSQASRQTWCGEKQLPMDKHRRELPETRTITGKLQSFVWQANKTEYHRRSSGKATLWDRRACKNTCRDAKDLNVQNYWKFVYAVKWTCGRKPTTSGNLCRLVQTVYVTQHSATVTCHCIFSAGLISLGTALSDVGTVHQMWTGSGPGSSVHPCITRPSTPALGLAWTDLAWVCFNWPINDKKTSLLPLSN